MTARRLTQEQLKQVARRRALEATQSRWQAAGCAPIAPPGKAAEQAVPTRLLSPPTRGPKTVQGPRLTRQAMDTIRDAYLDGETVPRIAVRLHMGVRTVRRALQAMTIPLRDDRARNARHLTAHEVATVASLYRQGLSLDQIATATHIGTRVIRRHLVDAGMPITRSQTARTA